MIVRSFYLATGLVVFASIRAPQDVVCGGTIRVQAFHFWKLIVRLLGHTVFAFPHVPRI